MAAEGEFPNVICPDGMAAEEEFSDAEGRPGGMAAEESRM